MRIIIYGNNKNSLEEFCKLIDRLPLDVKVDKLIEYEDFIVTYKKHSNEYDIVYIDFNDKDGKKLKQTILNINPSQKIVTINNSFECSHSKGCEDCRVNTNSYRIFRPLNISNIIKSFKDIKCEKDYCDDTLDSKLLIIVSSFKNFEFDEKTYRIVISKGSKEILNHYYDLVILEKILSTNHINHTIEENYIQILKKDISL